MIKDNVAELLKTIPAQNPFGEPITLVAATKTQTVDKINQAIAAGITDIGENKAQEFRDKFDLVLPCRYHFFGRLQKNKVKYLIGKACLIQSVDDLSLAEEIDRQSLARSIVTDILIEINLGEAQKGGIPLPSAKKEYERIRSLRSVRVRGFMAVLPDTENAETLSECCLQMRSLYDIIKKDDENISILSMGMSHDYLTAIKYGSNMVRIGTKIFGARDYSLPRT